MPETEQLEGLVQVGLLLEPALKELLHDHLIQSLPTIPNIFLDVLREVNILILLQDVLVVGHNQVSNDSPHLV